MTFASVLSGLGSALYELPRKAVAFATIDEMGVKTCGNAKFILDSKIGGLNLATRGLDESGMREYAIGGMGKVESILHLKDYVSNCDSSYAIPTLTDTAQKVVNYAIEYAHTQGKEIPFFGSAEADLVVALTGLAIGGSIVLYKLANKLGGNKLFPDYSNLVR